MRTVDVRWRHVAGGLRAAARLEAELEGRWAMAIEHARDRRLRRRFVAACAAAAGSAVGAAVMLAVMSQQSHIRLRPEHYDLAVQALASVAAR